jgi:molybdopterin molybdotransferase
MMTMNWHEARNIAHGSPSRMAPSHVRLEETDGLQLAADVVALSPLPAFANSAMDGFAINPPSPFRIRGQVLAGDRWQGVIGPGEAVEIATGASIPHGTAAILRHEDARCRDGLVVALPGRDPSPGQHIRPVGEDVKAGEVVATTGMHVTPALVGLAASCGHDSLSVVPRPKVVVVVSGDELISSGTSGGGLVRDALGPMVPLLITRMGGNCVAVWHVRDDPEDSLQEALAEACRQDVDVVVATGSTSVGSTDRLRACLQRLRASLVVDGVDCRPGHPQLLARLDSRRWLVGLPGNPFAAFVSAYTLLSPLLAGMVGNPMPFSFRAAVTGLDLRSRQRTQIVPVATGQQTIEALPGHSSAYLGGAASADALAVVPSGGTDDGWVTVVPL